MNFGHHEQGDPPGAGRGVFASGQHQVDDVIGDVLVPAADENFGAGQTVGAVRILYGPGLEVSQIGPGFRFGQCHGTAPLTGVEFFKIQALLGVISEPLQDLTGPVVEARHHHQGHVGAEQIVLGHDVEAVGHALPAPLRVLARGKPAAFFQKIPGPLERFRHPDPAVFIPAPFGVTGLHDGEQLFDRQGTGLGHDHVHHFFVELGICFMGAQAGDIKLLMEHKIHIPPVSDDLGHGIILSLPAA